jgi:hypothetical protein
VIEKLKIWFAVHGQPQQVYSDNGPQYSSMEFKKFVQELNFEHVTSSPKYPLSNGLAKRAVQIVKEILKKCKIDGSDTLLAILAQRNTPRDDQLGSPAQRLMSRNTRTSLDNNLEILMPATISEAGGSQKATEILRRLTDATVTGSCKGRHGATGRVERRMVFWNYKGVCR